MRRTPGVYIPEFESIMGMPAEEMLKRACTDGECMDAVRAAAEEGDYRLLVRVAGSTDFSKPVREEAGNRFEEAVANAIRFSTEGRETSNVLELAEIMDSKGISPKLKLSAFVGLKYLLRNNSECLIIQIENGDDKKYRDFVSKRKSEAPPADKPSSTGKRKRVRP